MARKEEKFYKTDFWKAAKDVSNGTFGKVLSEPTFTKSTADELYSNRYEKIEQTEFEDLLWFSNVDIPTNPYNLKTKDIKKLF